jgi:hypothetical protein
MNDGFLKKGTVNGANYFDRSRSTTITNMLVIIVRAVFGVSLRYERLSRPQFSGCRRLLQRVLILFTTALTATMTRHM